MNIYIVKYCLNKQFILLYTQKKNSRNIKFTFCIIFLILLFSYILFTYFWSILNSFETNKGLLEIIYAERNKIITRSLAYTILKLSSLDSSFFDRVSFTVYERNSYWKIQTCICALFNFYLSRVAEGIKIHIAKIKIYNRFYSSFFSDYFAG